ncbi:MAG: PilX N-terminal domain-containing pilus assembly protein [Candidatus Acidiferrales bacterium]
MSERRSAGIALITVLMVLLLVSSIVAGFIWLVMTDQGMSGNTAVRQQAFYGAEAGMEKLTADLGNLFDADPSPSGKEINALMGTANLPTIAGVNFVDPDVGTPASGFTITFIPDKNGNPTAQNHTIASGSFQGLVGLLTPYTLTVVANTNTGGEVKLQRTVQSVQIPVFQFGIFSQTDLSFFAGPNFNFGGRVHTNGNLWLAEGNGSTLTLSDRVTAVGEVIRNNLSNGVLAAGTGGGYTGTVKLITTPGSYRALGSTEGSVTGNYGTGYNVNWHSLSLSTYNGNMRDGDLSAPTYTGVNGTGAKNLNLKIATPNLGGSPIDLIRRPVQGEDKSAGGKLGERYYDQASLRILLSDNPADIMSLPCIDTSTQPIDLSLLAQPVTSGTYPAAITAAATKYGTTLVPLPASGAAGATYTPQTVVKGAPAGDGYWLPNGAPIITGYIKIEAATGYGFPCGTWKDVTAEILGLGYAARNLYPNTVTPAPTLPLLPATQQPPSACAGPNPNAVIMIARVRDNPSNAGATAGCGVLGATITKVPSDYWPNVFFDPREGNPRVWCPTSVASSSCGNLQPTLQGLMYYVELDVANLEKWFLGTIGSSGAGSADPAISSNNFVVYFSDRRSNYTAAAIAGIPASPSGNETGEFGFNDFVNPASANGCPNNAMDTGEDLDGLGGATPLTYGALAGQSPRPLIPGGAYSTATNLLTQMVGFTATAALSANWKCASPAYITTAPAIWPGWYVNNTQEARENPSLYFRRALKLVRGTTINLGACPNGVNCGLTIASENPVYIQGDYNAPAGGFNAPYGASAVISDALTFLSNNWNDINSFSSTYSVGLRKATSSNYRLAVASGKGISFPHPSLYATYQDFGTDGGVHNFLRYLEDWGGQALNYRGSIVSFYYNRQAVGIYKYDGAPNGTVYQPPTRGYNFDTDFLTPELLPPRTPAFLDVNAIGFTQYVLPN